MMSKIRAAELLPSSAPSSRPSEGADAAEVSRVLKVWETPRVILPSDDLASAEKINFVVDFQDPQGPALGPLS